MRPSSLSTGSKGSSLAPRFAPLRRLTVRQRKRWTEILLSFELRNKYAVYDQDGHGVLTVEEVDTGLGALLARLLLGPMRPFKAMVSDAASAEPLLLLRRPFRFFFHRLEVVEASSEPLGAIERRFAWVRRLYDISDRRGRVVGQIVGPFFKPWTFELHFGGRRVGSIVKRWGGLTKELFTDADSFRIEFEHPGISPDERALLLCAGVFIDMQYFEAKANSSSSITVSAD